MLVGAKGTAGTYISDGKRTGGGGGGASGVRKSDGTLLLIAGGGGGGGWDNSEKLCSGGQASPNGVDVNPLTSSQTPKFATIGVGKGGTDGKDGNNGYKYSSNSSDAASGGQGYNSGWSMKGGNGAWAYTEKACSSEISHRYSYGGGGGGYSGGAAAYDTCYYKDSGQYGTQYYDSCKSSAQNSNNTGSAQDADDYGGGGGGSYKSGTNSNWIAAEHSGAGKIEIKQLTHKVCNSSCEFVQGPCN